jgi:3D (Asp-Asp-Asp) domain-containing protein
MSIVKLLILSLFLSSCAGKQLVSSVPEGRKVRVCLTTYSKYDDKWTRKGLTSTGKPLSCGKTCAVDPKVIPYGSKIVIPELGMGLSAVDTGSAVVSRKAARRRGEPNTPVVDIYFEKKSDARAFANSKPYFVDAYIIQ